MTTSPAVTESDYTLTGTNVGPFATVFPYFDPAEVQVWLTQGGGVPVLLTSGADYTLTAAAPTVSGGSVTLAAGLPGAGWPAATTLGIARLSDSGQPSAFGEALRFSPQAMEQAVDYVARQVQDLYSVLARTAMSKPGQPAQQFPSRTALAGQLLGGAALTGALIPVDPASVAVLGGAYQRASAGAVSRPFVNRLMGRRYLTDFVDPALWAAIRNGTNVAPLVNSLGQDSWAAALADIPSAGGDLTLEEGTFLIPAGGLLLTKPGEIKGIRKGTTLKTASATDDMVTLKGFGIIVAGLRFAASVPRTGGACARFVGGFTSQDWVQDCTASLPFMQVHFDRLGGLNVTQSHVINFNVEDNVVAGGGFALLESANASTIESCTSGAVAGQSAYGIKVTSAADLTLLNNQMLSFNRNLYLIPDATCEIDSVRSMANFFDNSSFHALEVDTTNGPVQRCGSVNDWFLSGATGSSAINISSPNGTYSADGYDFDCVQIPSAGAGSGGTANGVLLNGNVKNVHLTSGFICKTQTGFVTLAAGGHSPAHFSLGVGMRIGPHSGLGANNNGVTIDAGADYFQVYADTVGNVTSNISNAAGTSANRRVVAGLF